MDSTWRWRFWLAPGAEASIQVLVAPVDDAPAESGEYRWRPYPSGWSESKVSRAPGTAPITRWRVDAAARQAQGGIMETRGRGDRFGRADGPA